MIRDKGSRMKDEGLEMRNEGLRIRDEGFTVEGVRPTYVPNTECYSERTWF